MDFSLSEETTLLKNSAERFLQEKCPPSLVRELIKDDTGFSKEIWKEMAELGWLGLIYDEKYGGSEGTFFDLLILFEEIGRVLLPSPFFCSSVLSGLVIYEAGDATLKDEYLPAIIQGKKILTLALLDEQGRYDGHDPKMEAKRLRVRHTLSVGPGFWSPTLILQMGSWSAQTSRILGLEGLLFSKLIIIAKDNR